MEYKFTYQSPLGTMVAASDGINLTGLWFEGQKYYPQTLLSGVHQERLPVFERTGEWLEIYFSGNAPAFTPPLAPSGREFRRSVWNRLLQIPYGQTTTYGEIARRVAEQTGIVSMSAQAVGGAVGHNPISIIIPCHRVVGTSGSLTGYAGGIDKKIELLSLEGIDTSRFSRPMRSSAL